MNSNEIKLIVAVGVGAAIYYYYNDMKSKKTKQPFPEAMICESVDDCADDNLYTCVPSSNPGISDKVCKWQAPMFMCETDEVCGEGSTCVNGKCVTKPKLPFGCSKFGCWDNNVCVNGKCVPGTCAQLKAAGRSLSCGSGLGCIDAKAGQQYFSNTNGLLTTAKTSGVQCAYIAPSSCPVGQIYTPQGNSIYTKKCSKNYLIYGKWYTMTTDSVNNTGKNSDIRSSPGSGSIFYEDMKYAPLIRNGPETIGLKHKSSKPTNSLTFAIYPDSTTSSNTVGSRVQYTDNCNIAIANPSLSKKIRGKTISVSQLKGMSPPTNFEWSWVGASGSINKVWFGAPYSPSGPGVCNFNIMPSPGATVNVRRGVVVGESISFRLLSAGSANFTGNGAHLYLVASSPDRSSIGTFGTGFSDIHVNYVQYFGSTYLATNRFWS